MEGMFLTAEVGEEGVLPPSDGALPEVGDKRKREISSEDSEDSDSSWVASDEDSEDTPVVREIHTRSRGPVEKVNADAILDRVDEVVNNESDFSTTTEEDEEEDEEEDAAEEEEEESSSEDDEYSDDDSFVTSEDEAVLPEDA